MSFLDKGVDLALKTLEVLDRNVVGEAKKLFLAEKPEAKQS